MHPPLPSCMEPERKAAAVQDSEPLVPSLTPSAATGKSSGTLQVSIWQPKGWECKLSLRIWPGKSKK